jgi:hypothetical protein
VIFREDFPDSIAEVVKMGTITNSIPNGRKRLPAPGVNMRPPHGPEQGINFQVMLRYTQQTGQLSRSEVWSRRYYSDFATFSIWQEAGFPMEHESLRLWDKSFHSSASV